VISALLDTQPLLWVLAGDRRLPGWLAEEVDDAPSAFGVSAVSLWEIAIKRSTGKLTVPDHLPDIVSDLGFSELSITRRQVWAVADLPFHHRDPFDRLLIAQAADLDLPIVSGDRAFAEYGVETRW